MRRASEFDDVRRHALEYHAAILEAIRAGDPEQARPAMHDHIEQTQNELRIYVLKAEPSGQAARTTGEKNSAHPDTGRSARPAYLDRTAPRHAEPYIAQLRWGSRHRTAATRAPPPQ